MAIKDRLYDVPVVGTAMRVQDRYNMDAGDQFAGAIGFFGFLSLFPLMLLALAATGFVLADATDQQLRDVAQTIQNAIPGFSAALGGEGGSIERALDGVIRNRGAVAGIGAVTTLLSGLRIVNSAQTATLVIFRVDLLAVSGVKRKLQQVLALVLLGLLAIAGVVASGALGVLEEVRLFGVMEVLAPVLVWIGTYALDVGLFLAAYVLLSTTDGPPWRQLVPGAMFAGLGWTLLKGFGATYVSNQVASAGELYGALGGVIGLLLLMYLAGRLYVYGAELSAVRSPDPDNPAETAESAEMGGFAARADADDDAAAAAATGTAGPPLFDRPAATDPARNVDRPRPAPFDRPRRARSDRPAPGTSPRDAALAAPTASDATRARLATLPDQPPREGQGRQALGFALAVGALAGIVGALRPWDDD